MTKRILKPPMMPDTAHLVNNLLPFLSLNPETVTPQEMIMAVTLHPAFSGKKALIAQQIKENNDNFLFLQKTLGVGLIMLRVGLGQREPGKVVIDAIEEAMKKVRPEIRHDPEIGWIGVKLVTNDKTTAFDLFEVDVIKTISESFNVFQRTHNDLWEDARERLEAAGMRRPYKPKPNGAYYVGMCPKCETVFEKKQSNQEYCSKACGTAERMKRLRGK